MKPMNVIILRNGMSSYLHIIGHSNFALLTSFLIFFFCKKHRQIDDRGQQPKFVHQGSIPGQGEFDQILIKGAIHELILLLQKWF